MTDCYSSSKRDANNYELVSTDLDCRFADAICFYIMKMAICNPIHAAVLAENKTEGSVKRMKQNDVQHPQLSLYSNQILKKALH